MSKKNVVTTSVVGLLSSVLAFLGIIGCCGFPLIAASLAWFGIGASQLGFLSKYQSIFTGIAILALMYGFYKVYFKKVNSSSDCCVPEENEESSQSSCCEPSKKTNWLAKTMLWIGVVAVAGTFFMNEDRPDTVDKPQNCCPTTTVTPEKEVQEQNPCCSSNDSIDIVTKKAVAPKEKTSYCTDQE